MGERIRRVVRATLLAGLVAALTLGGTAAPAAAAASRTLTTGALQAMDLVMSQDSTAALLHQVEGTQALTYGSDGRLTFLLLGMDAFGLTDAISVLTINPKTGKMAAASFPRDTAQMKLPNGKTLKGRINSIVKRYTSQLGSRAKALDEFRKIIAFNMGVEIDHVAMLRFGSFTDMMDRIGPITVTTRPARDPYGVYFPAASNYELAAYGDPCRYPTECHIAILYARTRKGKGNSDFIRQARHVDIVYAAIQQKRSFGTDEIAALVAAAQGHGADFYSSLPMTLGNATELYALIKKGNLAAVNRVVFKPTAYSTKISGGGYRLKLTAVRTWVRKYFKNI